MKNPDAAGIVLLMRERLLHASTAHHESGSRVHNHTGSSQRADPVKSSAMFFKKEILSMLWIEA